MLLAAPRGFCAGVEMAIKALAWMVRVFEPPVYCYHEIVHNQVVVDRFRQLGRGLRRRHRRGARRRPADAVGPRLGARGGRRGPGQRAGAVVDAVCPLVTKVHHEVKVRAGKGYTVVYVGHEGHDEAVGTMAVAPDAVRLVENEADVAAPGRRRTGRWPSWPRPRWPSTSGRACWPPPRERFPELWVPGRSDLCFATTNRQARAQGHRRPVPTPWSSSARPTPPTPWPWSAPPGRPAARGCCGSTGPTSCPTTWPAWSASPPGPRPPRSWSRPWSTAWRPGDGVEEVDVTDEDEYFPLPRELRELLRAVSAAAAVAGCAPAPRVGSAAGSDPGRSAAAGDRRPDGLADGRHLVASDVLDALAR